MTVLVDTSVWLRYLRGEEAGLIARPWIMSGQALVHPFVVGELLLGGLSAENEALLRSLPWCAPPSPEALYDFIRRHDLAGTGTGWVDAALLAAARMAGAQLATFDTPLARCARRLAVHQRRTEREKLEARIVAEKSIVLSELSEIGSLTHKLRRWYSGTNDSRLNLMDAITGGCFQQKEWHPDPKRVLLTAREIVLLLGGLHGSLYMEFVDLQFWKTRV